MKRNQTLCFFTGIALALASLQPMPAHAKDSIFRYVSIADLPTLDPSQSTAGMVNEFAVLVYDTLFAVDSTLTPQPQMVDTYTVSDDGLTYTFVLRDGLKWHDGAPVLAEDAVASLQRYFARDAVGGQLGKKVGKLDVVDAKTFSLALTEPYGLVLNNLAKYAPVAPYMYPKRLISAGPDVPISEVIGSGPYMFDKAAWQPGSKIVLRRNPDYVARTEPQDILAGSRAAGSDAIEINIIPDSQTSISALLAGEVDMISRADPDTLPILRADDNIVVETRDPRGVTILLRFNMLNPPFNDVRARKAFAMVVDQSPYLAVVASTPEDGKECKSIFTCDSPYTTLAGAEGIGTLDIEAAKKLVKESGYNGEPIVVLQPTDIPDIQTFALIAAEQLRSIGFNVELAASDWATLAQRRARKVPQSEGGWNMFITTTEGVNMESPMTNLPGNTNCETSWVGWPCDAEAEAIKDKFAMATALDERKALAEQFQKRIYDLMTFVPAGQFVEYAAWRKDVENVVIGPLSPLYGVKKAGQ